MLALLFLSLLLLAGGALLTMTTVDIWIGDNYRTAVQLQHLAEAGIEEARHSRLVSGITPSQMLVAAAGPDGLLSASNNPDALLQGDDQPLVPSQLLKAGGSAPAARYSVFLRNDVAEGAAVLVDSNRILNLLSIGAIGQSRKVLAAVVAKSGFPMPAAAVTAGVFTGLDWRLQTPAWTERILDGIVENATDIYHPPWNGVEILGNVGSPSNYQVVVVNGNCEFGPASGYGLLVVRGDLLVTGNFTWNGLILVIGQGTMTWPAAAVGQITGAVFISRTRASDQSAGNPIGSLLTSLGPALANFSGPGTVSFDAVEIDRANRPFPYVVVAYKEY